MHRNHGWRSRRRNCPDAAHRYLASNNSSWHRAQGSARHCGAISRHHIIHPPIPVARTRLARSFSSHERDARNAHHARIRQSAKSRVGPNTGDRLGLPTAPASIPTGTASIATMMYATWGGIGDLAERSADDQIASQSGCSPHPGQVAQLRPVRSYPQRGHSCPVDLSGASASISRFNATLRAQGPSLDEAIPPGSKRSSSHGNWPGWTRTTNLLIQSQEKGSLTGVDRY